MNKNICVISRQSIQTTTKIPVVVYARVSTKSENQSDSLMNQIAHYKESVGTDPRYELKEIYYDFGISGYKQSRTGFQRMMKDAEAGNFNLVITKAITRFARNTQTVLESTRRLKELGIGVYFELQGINTLSQEGELLMTLFAAFGQAENEGARKHTLMSLKRNYEKGVPNRQLQRCMGYRKGDDGEFYPDQYAPLVLEMFEMAADGYTPAQITNFFNSEGRMTHNGKPFHRATVTKMLRNVAYKGDFIGQRYYVDENRHQRRNNEELPMYFFECDHIPIVSSELWKKAQSRLDNASRRAIPTKSRLLPLTDENYPYRHALFCARCGHKLNRAVRAGRVLWECSGKAKWSKGFCSGVSATDDEVRSQNISAPVYISPIIEKGVVQGHRFVPVDVWSMDHQKKAHKTTAPALTEENYPYMNRIYCKYCGSRLRRLINKDGSITWICNGMSRHGKAFCRGVRVPDEKLNPLKNIHNNVYIGKETINGKECYGYSRKADREIQQD